MKVFLKGSVKIIIRHFNKLHFLKFWAVSLEFSFKFKKVFVWLYNIFFYKIWLLALKIFTEKTWKKLTEKLFWPLKCRKVGFPHFHYCNSGNSFWSITFLIISLDLKSASNFDFLIYCTCKKKKNLGVNEYGTHHFFIVGCKKGLIYLEQLKKRIF
jgi:hypothetical protein